MSFLGIYFGSDMLFPPFATSEAPLVIGHRGASGHHLENSLAALQAAADGRHPGRCDGVELDIHCTSDGDIVVHHDPVLANGDAIAELPLSMVRAAVLADGSTVPTLREALQVLSGLDVFIEAKHLPPACDAALLNHVRRARAASCHIHAFDLQVVARLAARDPGLSLGALMVGYPADPAKLLRGAGARTLWQEASVLDAPLVDACHAAGIAVIGWTVNDRSEAERLSAIGVDGLCGDWPERLRPAE